MSFDDEPDAPLHGECAAEIQRLEHELAASKEVAEKFKWQVRDTCTRAEAAEALVKELTPDAARYRHMLKVGRCNEKAPTGFTRSASKLKALFSFRYWCEPEKVSEVIDEVIANG